MRKVFVAVLALMLLMVVPADAASTLSKYSLIVNGKQVSLSESTGYIGKSGSRLTIPIKTVCEALSIDYTLSKDGKLISMDGPNDTLVAMCSGYSYAKVDGKKKPLKVKAYMKNGLLMTDLSILKLLGVSYKTASAASLKAKGYSDGAVSISQEGQEVSFPTLAGEQSFAAKLSAASSCDQMVVVQYDSGSKATLTMHQKDENGLWKQLLSSYAYVGKNGIGKTKEGDNKTPSGTYNLKMPFGIKDNPGTSLSYVKVTKYHYWCGTSGSDSYNQLIDTRVTSRKRTSSDEYLINFKGVYNYCAFIDYNASGTAGKGSCIFLHCTGSNKYTAGCVAVPESVMIKILKAVKPGCKIVIYKP